MIGFVLGTGEGRAILSHVNKYTDEIVVSTATEYGYEIYKEFKAKHFNYRPLNEDEFKDLITKFGIDTFVDASHPYACEVSKTLIKVCSDLNIEYIRYERKSYFNDLKDNENIIFIDKYEYLEELFKNIDGNILNTTGSNNALKIEGLKSEKNRIIHRILPSPKVISRLLDNGISMENIIAIKGPFGFEINNGIIKEYKIKALITKDSGEEGGMKEKIDSALINNVKIIVIKRLEVNYGRKFNNIEEMINFIFLNNI
ncbi:cobalt-precorrin-6A reductase [uncultured Clostridium sp.]|uniref:cobalt-precorrin-6A reductase n=1 Tax=uncultured Clostridium sp. TaxID=59620 RepID=UPI0026DB1676|nr:cobalt-precorrin-6A reductase [uncultured Clostridium sp.]